MVSPLPPTSELLEVARRVVWFQAPERTLQDPRRFLAYVMRYGTARDLAALQNAGIGWDHYREALDGAPAGVLDRRSWTYGQLKCGRTEVPPLPARAFVV